MPITTKCTTCNGTGYVPVLTSQHDDKKEIVKCHSCKGNKVIHTMTDQEESDYHADYW